MKFGERLPLMVMLHGCGQDAKTFAASTRMNVVAARERFLVLYPEQDRLSNAKGLLELVRYPLRPRRRRGGADHGRDRPGLPSLRRRSRSRRRRRTLRGGQHGGAAGHAPSRALQGRDDALGRRTRRCALDAVGGRRDAGPAQSLAAARACTGRACLLAAADGDPGRNGRGGLGPQRPGRRSRSGRMRPEPLPARNAASSAASAIR